MRRLIILLFILILSQFSGCDFVYKIVDKEGAEEKDLVGVSLPFESNATIEDIQERLTLFGYKPGRVDGKMGAQTRAAIEQFQKDNQLPETKKADAETWEKLTALDKYTLVEDGRINVLFIQEILKTLGYDVGDVDGKSGPQTRTAIKNFQKDFDLKADGTLRYQTLLKLSEFLIIEK